MPRQTRLRRRTETVRAPQVEQCVARRSIRRPLMSESKGKIRPRSHPNTPSQTPQRLNAELMLYPNVPRSFSGRSGGESCFRISSVQNEQPLTMPGSQNYLLQKWRRTFGRSRSSFALAVGSRAYKCLVQQMRGSVSRSIFAEVLSEGQSSRISI